MKNGISRVVADGFSTKGGEERNIYQALRSLMCSRWTKIITEDEVFTRRKLRRINLIPECAARAPFEVVPRSGGA